VSRSHTSFHTHSIRMESAKNSTLRRLNTLKQSISLNLTNKRDSGTNSAANCNSEFDFVSFECDVACDLRRGLNGFDTKDEKLLPAVQTKRGVLWQISGKIFSTWKERFCVLTENSLYSFSKKSASSTKSFKEVKLLDICDIRLVTENGQKILQLKINSMGKLALKRESDESMIDEWYLQFLSNVKSCYKQLLRRTRSVNPESLNTSFRRPLMGVSSLRL